MSLVSKIKPFLTRRNLCAALAIFGAVDGPRALTVAEASVPPLTWEAIIVILVGSCVGILFTLGIQVVLKSPRGVYFGWHFFFYGSIYFISSGASALLMSLWRNSFGPPALLCLVIGTGSFIGLRVMKPYLEA